MIELIALAAAAGFAFFALAVVLAYNSFIGKRNQVDNAYASVDVQLKKRYDLIPNLVSTVKGYAKHEKDLFTKITELRAQAIQPRIDPNTKVQIDNELTGLLKSLFMVAENYPQLKASENFMHLQRTLTEVEEQLSASRRAYNSAVLAFNNLCDMFPTNLIASVFGFKRRQFFEIPEGEDENVDVKKALK